MKTDGTEMQRSGFTYLLLKGDAGCRIHEIIATDIDTAVADSLKALDPNRPIREADISACPRHVRFTPRKRTSELSRGMSALCQKETYAVQHDCCSAAKINE